jgi:Na+/melibiose symporter-like transporter
MARMTRKEQERQVSYAAAWVASYVVPLVVIGAIWGIAQAVPDAGAVFGWTVIVIAVLYALLSISFLIVVAVACWRRSRTPEARARREAARATGRATTAAIVASWKRAR